VKLTTHLHIVSKSRMMELHLHSAFVFMAWYLITKAQSVVGIATGYGLDDRGVGVRVTVRSRIFTSPIVQTGSGVHPTSYMMGTGGSFPGVKRPGREAGHSPPSNAEVKKMWIYTSIHPRLHGVVLN
jgi:hypothetical protein